MELSLVSIKKALERWPDFAPPGTLEHADIERGLASLRDLFQTLQCFWPSRLHA